MLLGSILLVWILTRWLISLLVLGENMIVFYFGGKMFCARTQLLAKLQASTIYPS